MTSSISQTILLLLATIFSLTLTCLVARYPRSAVAGISLGALVGVVLLIISSGLVSFIGYVIPLGQIDFWIGDLFYRFLN